MRLRTKLLHLTKSTFTPYVAIITIIIASVFSSMPSKSCEKQDSLKTEVREIKTIESNARCEKDKVKEEKEKFNMMSLNLVYYIMNKFLDTNISKE